MNYIRHTDDTLTEHYIDAVKKSLGYCGGGFHSPSTIGYEEPMRGYESTVRDLGEALDTLVTRGVANWNGPDSGGPCTYAIKL